MPTADGRRRVAVLHPAFDGPSRWIDDFAPDDSGYVFEKVSRSAPQRSWHERGARTGAGEWGQYLAYAARATRTKPDIVVTNFPQLALTASFLRRAGLLRSRLVGWSFNVGGMADSKVAGPAGRVLRAADRLIVHSTEEIVRYADRFGLPEDRFAFVPLQHGTVPAQWSPDAEAPFVLAMGSAGRDYAALFEAARGFPGRIVVVAKPDAVAGLDAPHNVELRSGLTLEACRALNARATLSVVPIANTVTASGQVTFLTSMAQGVPVIATDCLGTADYLTDGESALTVPPGDADALRRAMTELWNDAARRRAIAEGGHAAWQARFSDEAAGRALVRVLDEAC